MSQQLPLPVNIPDQQLLESFYSGRNQQVVAHMRSLVTKPDQLNQITFISGEVASGKSHLLFGLCHLAESKNQYAAYIDFNQHQNFTPEILDNLTQANIVCLDNVDQLVHQAEWELALFNLFNSVKQVQSCRLILTAKIGPKAIPFDLPDLQSRMTWGVSYHLFTPNDEEKVQILSDRANSRGMQLSSELSRFICLHWQRDMHSLMQTIDQLDRLSLEQKRRLTLPFIKQALSL